MIRKLIKSLPPIRNILKQRELLRAENERLKIQLGTQKPTVDKIVYSEKEFKPKLLKEWSAHP
jgi:hypothetical protein